MRNTQSGHFAVTVTSIIGSAEALPVLCVRCAGCERERERERDLYQKLLEIEKEIVREVARGDKPYLRKSTDRKVERSLRKTQEYVSALRIVDTYVILSVKCKSRSLSNIVLHGAFAKRDNIIVQYARGAFC